MTGSADFDGRHEGTFRSSEPMMSEALQRIADLAAGPPPMASPALSAFLADPAGPTCSPTSAIGVALPTQRGTIREARPTTGSRRRWRARMAALAIAVSHLSVGAKCAFAAAGIAATVAAATQVGQPNPGPAEPATVPASVTDHRGAEPGPASLTDSDAPSGADGTNGAQDRATDDRSDADGVEVEERDDRSGVDGPSEENHPNTGDDRVGEDPRDDAPGGVAPGQPGPEDGPDDGGHTDEEPDEESPDDSSDDKADESPDDGAGQTDDDSPEDIGLAE